MPGSMCERFSRSIAFEIKPTRQPDSTQSPLGFPRNQRYSQPDFRSFATQRGLDGNRLAAAEKPKPL